MEMTTLLKILIGAAVGGAAATLNNILLVWTVKKALAGAPKKGRGVMFISLGARMLGLLLVVFGASVISGKDTTVLFSLLGMLGIMTFLSPRKRYSGMGKKAGK